MTGKNTVDIIYSGNTVGNISQLLHRYDCRTTGICQPQPANLCRVRNSEKILLGQGPENIPGKALPAFRGIGNTVRPRGNNPVGEFPGLGSHFLGFFREDEIVVETILHPLRWLGHDSSFILMVVAVLCIRSSGPVPFSRFPVNLLACEIIKAFLRLKALPSFADWSPPGQPEVLPSYPGLFETGRPARTFHHRDSAPFSPSPMPPFDPEYLTMSRSP